MTTEQMSQARELASLLLRTDPTVDAKLVQGVVAALEPPNKISVYLLGAPLPVGGIRYLDSFSPRVNDVIWLVKSGPDMFAIGKLQDDEFDVTLPWNTSWGILARQVLTGNSVNYTVTGNSDMALLGVPLRGDRAYAVKLNANHTLTANAVWALTFTYDGGGGGLDFARAYTVNEGYGLGDMRYAEGLLLTGGGAGAAPYDIRVRHSEITGTSTLSYQGSATLPRQLWIEDIGPLTRI